jgi:hypothetical protein
MQMMKIRLEILMRWSFKMWYEGHIFLFERHSFSPLRVRWRSPSGKGSSASQSQPDGCLSFAPHKDKGTTTQKTKSHKGVSYEKICIADAMHKGTKDKTTHLHKGVFFEYGVADAPHKTTRVRGTSASYVKSLCWCPAQTSASLPLRARLCTSFA